MSYLGDDPGIQEILNQVSILLSKSQLQQEEMTRYIRNINSIQQDLSQKIQTLTLLQQAAKENQQLLSENIDRLTALEKELQKNNNLPSTASEPKSYDSSNIDSQIVSSFLSYFKRILEQTPSPTSSALRSEPISAGTKPLYNFSLEAQSNQVNEEMQQNALEADTIKSSIPSLNTLNHSSLTIEQLFTNYLNSNADLPINFSDACLSVFRNFILQYNFVTSGFSDYQSISPKLICLSSTIANNYKHLSSFIKLLKNSMGTTDELVYHLPSSSNDPSFSLAISFAKQLYEIGYFNGCTYQKANRILKFMPSNKVAYNQFITGKWLEIYVNQIANRAFKTKYEDITLQGLVLSNVKIAHPSDKCISHEFDTVIITQYELYFIECKTGEYESCISKYERIAEKFNLPLSSIFVVVLEMSESECQRMTNLHNMRFCNQSTFYTTLLDELGKSATNHL